MNIDRKTRLENYLLQLKEEEEKELNENSVLIQEFTEFCKLKKIEIKKENFHYVQKIGIIADYPNLVHLLNNKVVNDKEELVDFDILENEFEKRRFASGYFYSDKYMVMAHHYFRRGHYQNNNFAPRFIDIFWDYKVDGNDKYIALDFDRVRINVDNRMFMEFDTWFGAKFKENISDIEDGIVKLRPPMDLDPFHIDFFFGGIYSLDIKWTSKNGIKIFQAEEFQVENKRIVKNDKEYYPVRYIHAEFDTFKGYFRHFDGAIHFYTENEYYQRRDNDFNYNNKNNLQLKTLSQKLFKVNGQITTTEWVNLVSHFLTGNPLVLEYFEGKLPDDLLNTVEIVRNSK